MAPSYSKPLPQAPEPTRVLFDPFNSSSTGHQRAENRLSGSTAWRDSRQYKLKHQFADRTGGGGAKHLSDLVGAGSANYGQDGRKDNGSWEKDASGLRPKGWQDIRGMFNSVKKRSSDSAELDQKPEESKKRCISPSLAQSCEHKSNVTVVVTRTPKEEAEAARSEVDARILTQMPKCPQIFRGLTIYLNGTTMPLISDHKLRQLWVQHGGNASISLGRKTVTHVVLAEPRCGGGLASGKIQKENTLVRGKGIKYVTVKWVLDSIEKEIRQPESRYTQAEAGNKLGGAGQQSVASLFRPRT